MSELRLYNTRTRRKERFEPLDGKLARVYSCGPTVYARQHLGNLRAYLFADLLKRVLRCNGYGVRHVINITDVGHLTDDADLGEDKMEVAARKEGLSAWEIAEKWTSVFKQDLEKLNILSPEVWCKAIWCHAPLPLGRSDSKRRPPHPGSARATFSKKAVSLLQPANMVLAQFTSSAP